MKFFPHISLKDSQHDKIMSVLFHGVLFTRTQAPVLEKTHRIDIQSDDEWSTFDLEGENGHCSHHTKVRLGHKEDLLSLFKKKKKRRKI